jgi:hypothetical protein
LAPFKIENPHRDERLIARYPDLAEVLCHLSKAAENAISAQELPPMKDDEAPSLEVLRIAANAFRDDDVSDLPESWKASGIFVDGKVPCPAARQAISLALADKTYGVLDVLTVFSSTRGLAFELSITTLPFLKKGRDTRSKQVRVYPVKRDGTNHPEEGLMLEARRIHHVKQKEQAPLVVDTLQPGDLVLPPHDFPVVDAIFFTARKQLVFLQVSMQTYTSHDKGYEDLFVPRTELGDQSVAEFFVRCANLSTTLPLTKPGSEGCSTEKKSKKRTSKTLVEDPPEQVYKLPENVYYVFVTTQKEETEVHGKPRVGADVLLLPRERLEPFGSFVTSFLRQCGQSLDLSTMNIRTCTHDGRVR